MNASQAKILLLEMLASWPQKEMTNPERAIWYETLAEVQYEAAREALKTLRKAQDWLPTHHQFTEAAEDATRRLSSQRGLPSGDEHAPRVCALCDGSGWMTVEVVSGAAAVARCRCTKGKTNDKHESGCTCLSCHYGPDRAADIRRGEDGSRRPAGEVHPLTVRSTLRELDRG